MMPNWQLSKKFVVSLRFAKVISPILHKLFYQLLQLLKRVAHYADWQGKEREFDAAVESLNRSDVRILSMLADEMGRSINLPSVSAARKEIASIRKLGWCKARHEKRSAAGQLRLAQMK
jgi:NADH-quinone oxidoreductase subunit G